MNSRRTSILITVAAIAALLTVPRLANANNDHRTAGYFTTSGSTILDPEGKPFIPVGANFGAPVKDANGQDVWLQRNHGHDMTTPKMQDAIERWNWNTLRINAECAGEKTISQENMFEAIDAVVDIYTPKKKVVIIECHDTTGKDPKIDSETYQNIQTFWEQAIQRYANNPYVWFNHLNEFATSTDLTYWQNVINDGYKLFDEAGSRNLLVFQIPGWGQNLQTMTNPDVQRWANTKCGVVWDLHSYGSAGIKETSDYSQIFGETLQAVTNAELPVMIGEIGFDWNPERRHANAVSYERERTGALAAIEQAPHAGVGILAWHANGDAGERSTYNLMQGDTATADQLDEVDRSEFGEAFWKYSQRHGQNSTKPPTQNTTIPNPETHNSTTTTAADKPNEANTPTGADEPAPSTSDTAPNPANDSSPSNTKSPPATSNPKNQPDTHEDHTPQPNQKIVTPFHHHEEVPETTNKSNTTKGSGNPTETSQPHQHQPGHNPNDTNPQQPDPPQTQPANNPGQRCKDHTNKHNQPEGLNPHPDTSTTKPETKQPSSEIPDTRHQAPEFTEHSNINNTSLPVAELMEPGKADNAPSPTEGQFRATCSISHHSYDDPVVFPNKVGAAHLHTFFGNTETDAFSTAETLFDSGGGTCSGGALNRSAYWFPSLLSDDQILVPKSIVLYYKSKQPDNIEPIPKGLRMLTGATPGEEGFPKSNDLFWSCGESGKDENRTNQLPDCSTNGTLNATIAFPQCWDGTNLDSKDHRSHMQLIGESQTCPETHPVRIPQVRYLIYWDVSTIDANTLHISSDRHDGINAKPGTTLHADLIAAWHPDTLNLWTTNCVRARRNCSGGQTGTPQKLRKMPTYQGPQLAPIGQTHEH